MARIAHENHLHAQTPDARRECRERLQRIDFKQAVKMVVADVRQSYPEMTDHEALAHVYNTITIETLDWDNSELAHAYQIVLEEAAQAMGFIYWMGSQTIPKKHYNFLQNLEALGTQFLDAKPNGGVTEFAIWLLSSYQFARGQGVGYWQGLKDAQGVIEDLMPDPVEPDVVEDNDDTAEQEKVQ